MAKERKASVIYEGNASQLVYAFPFDYLRKKFVKVEDIYTNITELTMGVDYTVEDKQVRLVKGIPLGHSVKIYRETTTAPLVEWQDASVLRSADLSLQEVQLLHLAEETADKVFDSGMSTAYDNPNCWDGQYKRIINALDPIEDGDVVTLRYIKANQDSLLNQLKNTGATQNSSIVATGDSQNKRLTDTGNSYVSTMTTLKDTATTKATEAGNSAELSKKWAMSSTSPDGVSGNKSSKTWAEEAKTSASNSAASASASQISANASASSATNSANSANASKQSASASANSASAAASSASDASTSAANAKISETNASNSAKAAKQSEENAKTWDPTQYVTKAAANQLLRNKAYAVGDIAYSPNLPSYLYLECTTAGTTGATEPDMSTLSGGVIVNDGTAQFSVKTVCAKEYVEFKNEDLLSKIAYRAGDTYSLNSWYTIPGNVTNGGRDIIFVIPTSKIILANKMRIDKLEITVRQNGKYLIGTAGTHVEMKKYFSKSEYNESNNSMFNCGIYICLKLNSAPSGIINNSPLSVLLGNVSIYFYN